MARGRLDRAVPHRETGRVIAGLVSGGPVLMARDWQARGSARTAGDVITAPAGSPGIAYSVFQGESAGSVNAPCGDTPWLFHLDSYGRPW